MMHLIIFLQNKKVSQPQNYIDSNFESEGCDDSEILHGEKEKYNTTTVNEHVEEGKPVVLVGYITENDGTTKLVTLRNILILVYAMLLCIREFYWRCSVSPRIALYDCHDVVF